MESFPKIADELLQVYSRTPEIETADLTQSHAGHYLSLFQDDCLYPRNSNTATKLN